MEKEAIKFLKKQLKDTAIKIRGAINLLENNKPVFARNKLLGINQKIAYVYLKLEEYEKLFDNQQVINEKDSQQSGSEENQSGL